MQVKRMGSTANSFNTGPSTGVISLLTTHMLISIRRRWPTINPFPRLFGGRRERESSIMHARLNATTHTMAHRYLRNFCNLLLCSTIDYEGGHFCHSENGDSADEGKR